VLKALAPEIPKLHNLLVEPQRVHPLMTASGLVNHPIGRTRLTALHLLVALLHTHDAKITGELIELGTLKTCVVRPRKTCFARRATARPFFLVVLPALISWNLPPPFFSSKKFVAEYPENNFLHKFVYDIVMASLPSRTDGCDAENPPALYKHMFVGGFRSTFVAHGHPQVVCPPCPPRCSW
jgi:hypothetical protein